MKSSYFYFLTLLLLVSGCATFQGERPALDDALDGPRPEPYGEKVILLNVPPRLSVLQIRQSIMNAALRNNWSILESGFVDDNGFVVIRNRTSFYDSIFTLVFNPSLVEGFSESYVLNHSGNRSKRYTPPVRVDRLRKDIVKNLEQQIAGY